MPGTELGTQQALGYLQRAGRLFQPEADQRPSSKAAREPGGGALGRLNCGQEMVQPAHSVWMRMSLFLGSSTHLQMSSWVTGMAM